jgi:hypothetical protein
MTGRGCRGGEAVPADKAGDGLKLYGETKINKMLFTRPRLELALICPDAK